MSLAAFATPCRAVWARSGALNVKCATDGSSHKRGPGPTRAGADRLSGLQNLSSAMSALGYPRVADRRSVPSQTEQLQPLPPAALPLGTAGLVAVAADVFAPVSAHLLQRVDTAAHAWVTLNWSLEIQHYVAARIISDAAITGGLAGWAAAAAAALHTRDPRLAAALATCTAAYWLGGGRVPHADPVLVDVLKHGFHRQRPSEYYNTFSFPSGHTTAATFICGTLLVVLLPLALQALERRQQEQGQQEQGQQAVGADVAAATQQAARWLLEHRWQLWGGAAVTTAAGRVLADVHWCSDTLAGACLGVALTAGTAQICSSVDGWLLSRRQADTRDVEGRRS